MPAAVQSAAYFAVHSCDAVTNPSAMTVEFMLDGVTHSGFSRTDFTAVLDGCPPLPR